MKYKITIETDDREVVERLTKKPAAKPRTAPKPPQGRTPPKSDHIDFRAGILILVALLAAILLLPNFL